jgi:two-component system, chemotaxis family, protein-glutamate methylesterase/glutaminase
MYIKKYMKNKMARPLFAVGIGASAGGVNAISEVVSTLPKNLPAAYFIVLHLSRRSLGDILAEKIKKSASIPLRIATDNELIRPSTIYIAPSDQHLLVKNGRILLGNGPPENRFRPCIDVLFRSLAAHFTNNCVGVVLTGYLADGTAGMAAIKESGGFCIVQDPLEAEVPDMPLSVLESVDVDDSLPLSKIGQRIKEFTKLNRKQKKPAPERVLMESKISEKSATSVDEVALIGDKTSFGCPECHGALWKIKNGNVVHYRCHVGHSYSEADLEYRQKEKLEVTLWMALRMMEERKLLLNKLARQNKEKGLQILSRNLTTQAVSLEKHIRQLKNFLFDFKKASSKN